MSHSSLKASLPSSSSSSSFPIRSTYFSSQQSDNETSAGDTNNSGKWTIKRISIVVINVLIIIIALWFLFDMLVGCAENPVNAESCTKNNNCSDDLSTTDTSCKKRILANNPFYNVKTLDNCTVKNDIYHVSIV